MLLIIGTAFTDLKTGSDVFTEVLSSDDLSHPHTILEPIIDSSDLTSTFQKIGESIEALGLGLLHNGDPGFISLTVPTYLSLSLAEDKIKEVAIQAKVISPLCKGRLPTWMNMTSLVVSEDEKESRMEYEGQYELLLEIGPDSMVYMRLVAASAEEGIRESDCRMERMIDLRVGNEVEVSNAATELVDRVLSTLSNPLAIQPLPESTYHKTLIEVKDPSLKRVFILDSSPNLVSSEIIAVLKAKYTTGTATVRTFPEIVLKTNPGPLLAKYALARSLKSYHNRLRYEAGDMICVFSVAPLCIGIVNADGSITTAIPRNYTLPNTRSLVFTTAKDGQRSATVTVVAGLAPRVEVKDGNIVIAQLSLGGLRPRAKGAHRIHVTIDVEHLGRTRIMAREDDFGQEIEGGGLNGGASASVELRDLCGEVDLEEMENMCDTYRDLAYDPAEDPAVRWAGTDFAGDLPE